MSNLLIIDKLVVHTQSSGQCCVELCQGDITDLDVKDKVDVVCVSVFGSRYTPLSDTLVGALHEKLKLSVKLLARDKAEDLRHAYMCWWSKPLPDHLPYRKLLCFENRGKVCRPQELVGNVFRCLVPILNNEPGTVITPLLNAGIQGVDEATMLVGMVEAAIKWMKAGLPLRQLKIVMYAKVVKGKVVQVNMRNLQGCLKSFKDLKERYDNLDVVSPAIPLEYDIYLSHSPEDDDIASMVGDKLRASKPDIKIYECKHVPDGDFGEEAFWQEGVFNVMLRSARVVPILSPAFLESKACVDLYNMALCCNRRAERDLLAPLYIERIEDMPTYMGLVQYTDCSPKDEAKIDESCRNLVQSLEGDTPNVHSEMVAADDSPLHYDVFVSYSHQDSWQAVSIVQKLQQLNPKLKIFFDRQELKVGVAWQKTLYHAIDGCRAFMALVSNTYTESAMCIEEFNLALAKHCSSDSMIRLLPVCIEPLSDPPPEFHGVKLINATPDVFDPAVEIICTSLVDWVAGGDWYPQLDSVFRRRIGMIVDAAEFAAERRRLQFFIQHGKGNNKVNCDDVELPVPTKGMSCPVDLKDADSEVCDVAFSCAARDRLFVNLLARVLREVSPRLCVKETAGTESERLALMESARKVVVFLSANYLESVQQVEEFHTVLLRQRYRSPARVLFPIILRDLPQMPTYFHLVDCEFNLRDAHWLELADSGRNASLLPPHLEDCLRKCEDSDSQTENGAFIGLIAAAHRLLLQLATEGEHLQTSPKAIHQPMLLNVLLLRSEVERLRKELNVGVKGGQEEKVTQASRQENDLLDVLDPQGSGSGTSCHKYVTLSTHTNRSVNANSSLSHTHYRSKEREVTTSVNKRQLDDAPMEDSQFQHRKEGSEVRSAASGSPSPDKRLHKGRTSSRSCMLV